MNARQGDLERWYQEPRSSLTTPTGRNYNKKGFPARLGKPEIGESEACDLRRTDLIVHDSGGSIYILRCKNAGQLDPKVVLPLLETRIIVECLEEYWSR